MVDLFKKFEPTFSIRSFTIDYGGNIFLGKDSNTNYENLSNCKTG